MKIRLRRGLERSITFFSYIEPINQTKFVIYINAGINYTVIYQHTFKKISQMGTSWVISLDNIIVIESCTVLIFPKSTSLKENLSFWDPKSVVFVGSKRSTLRHQLTLLYYYILIWKFRCCAIVKPLCNATHRDRGKVALHKGFAKIYNMKRKPKRI